MRSYYDILGVSKTATDEEIRKAYKSKALQYHPDRNKDDPKAEEKFKEVNEAYAVLKDKDKRKQYDMFGAEGFRKRYSQEDIFSNFDLNEILRGFGFSGGERPPSGFEDMFGGGGFSSPFESMFGTRQRGPRKGQDMVSDLTVTFEEAALGTEKNFSVQRDGRLEETSVKVPAGIGDGQKLRLAGKGYPGTQGGPPGDLYFKVRIHPHPVFQRDGNNILVEHKVGLSDALLGTTIQVPTLEGEKQVKVPAGTQPGGKLRLKGLGIPLRGGGRGDQIVKIVVTYPKELTPHQVKLMEDLRKSGL
ncbi:MAG: DnaJ domain-containing protein [Nitrospinaceae bacterium]|nr:DnaJ domain-containing protein [Nitrospinaceae bacterium]NIR56345.1 DnaJ domain-containing protein [Nitrospinaceae bacterium]NIS86805.1 DnaJ domain-containing protein [Nitrospinaceae bacterium]NIT83639.1 DnaJ domain-containing protein [Nitrospinaceae bacterium]NIU45842.1 DnaJ domain-containing protein [Nitrospinaceae bacterium]